MTDTPPQKQEAGIPITVRRKGEMKKRILSMLLTLGMVCTMLPVSVLATGTEDASEDPETITLNGVSESKTLTGTPGSNHNWTSANPDVATVAVDPEDSAKATVTAVDFGTTTVTHTYDVLVEDSESEEAQEAQESGNDQGAGEEGTEVGQNSVESIVDEPKSMTETKYEYFTIVVDPGNNVARISSDGGYTYYKTLDEAVAAAQNGETIELLADAEITSDNANNQSITFNKDLKFVGNYTIDSRIYWRIGEDTTVEFDGVELNIDLTNGVLPIGENPWGTMILSPGANLILDQGARLNITFRTNMNGELPGLWGEKYTGAGRETMPTATDGQLVGRPTAVTTGIYVCGGTEIEVQNGSAVKIQGIDTESVSYIGYNSATGKWETMNSSGDGYAREGSLADKITVSNGSSFEINGSNRGYANSPVISVTDSNFTVQNCTANGSNGGTVTATNSNVYYLNNVGHGLSATNLTLNNSYLKADGNGYYGIYTSSQFSVDGNSEVVVTKNSGAGDFAGLKLTKDVTDGLVEAGATVTITDNYCSGLSNNGKVVFEEGVDLTITGNNNDKGPTSNGGGIYNSGAFAKLTLPSNAVIYNNHANTAGDDIFNDTTATISFGNVGTDWYLDGGEDCEDLIDGWYDDSAGNRWEAHDAEALHVEEVTPGNISHSGLLAVKAAHGMIPYDPDDPDLPYDESHSKSKTATNLDENYESKVTLSLPAADYEPEIDVVFVIDDTSSTSSIFVKAAEELLEELRSKDNLEVNFGLVTFDAVARDWLAVTSGGKQSGLVSLSDENNYTAILRAIETKLASSGEGREKRLGGSNIEWPLAVAQEMLEEGTGTEQHVILFSDMYGYVYRGNFSVNGQLYQDVPLSKAYGSSDMGSLCISAPMFNTWEEVYTHVKDADDADLDSFFRYRDDNNNTDAWTNYWTIFQGISPAVPNHGEIPHGEHGSIIFTPFEKSSCLTYDQILCLLEDNVQVTIVNNDFDPEDGNTNADTIRIIKDGMLDALDDLGVTVIKKETTNGGTFDSDQMDEVFTTLENKLVQLVDAGSKVIDEIGAGAYGTNTTYDFAFVDDASELTLTVGNDTYITTKAEQTVRGATSVYYFNLYDENGVAIVPAKNGAAAPFILRYYADGATAYETGEKAVNGECFVWDINVPVIKDATVTLMYTVRLTNPQTAEGTYGVYDRDGDGKDDEGNPLNSTGLYTNNNATLYPVDSTETEGIPEYFSKPTVAYTVGEPAPTSGSLTLTKYVLDNDNSDRTFTFKVTIDGVKREASLTIPQGSTSQSTTITGLPLDVNYSVEEVPVNGYKAQYFGTGSGTITEADPDAEVTVVNVSDTTSALFLSKTVRNSSTNRDFTFTVTLTKDGNSASGTILYTGSDTAAAFTSGGTVTLSSGESAVIYGLPAGTAYTVTEGAVNNYTASYEVTGVTGTTTGRTASGTIDGGEVEGIHYTNTYYSSSTGGGGGSSGGGSSSHDDDDKPQLNKEDHIAYVSGYPDGTVQPEGYITREEVATIFFRLLTDASRADFITEYNPFPDVDADRWSFYSITTMNNGGLMEGRTNGLFDPGANITRAEFAVVAAQFSNARYSGPDKFTDISDHWARDYINRAAAEGWIAGYPDGTFGPDRFITRAEVMALVNEVLERAPDADHMLDDMIHWPDNPKSAWYYEDVQEATNCHSYTWLNTQHTSEDWKEITDMRTYNELVRDAFLGK